MEKVNLNAKPREQFGKGAAKRIRKEGLVPAIVYGHGMEPLAVSVDAKELYRALQTKAGENVLIDLNVEGVTLRESTCLIKELTHNPVSDKISHLDLTVISLTEKITVKVPINIENAEEAAGVKEGGVLDIILHEIEVECLPTEIPEKITVDVKSMNIGDSIHVKDLSIPEAVTCTLSEEESVIALHPPRKEEELVPAAEEAAEPEVIEKGKKAEGEKEEAAPAKEKEGGTQTAEKKEKKES
ncbi:MAG: 50S ribosomal protein L25/general stress protein Ctc [Candidatus Omnitrophica bacterium]|nr:50S ribosomal protein L25/general stress protein Ctc [Candidatus Omnitrophota bacterium]